MKTIFYEGALHSFFDFCILCTTQRNYHHGGASSSVALLIDAAPAMTLFCAECYTQQTFRHHLRGKRARAHSELSYASGAFRPAAIGPGADRGSFTTTPFFCDTNASFPTQCSRQALNGAMLQIAVLCHLRYPKSPHQVHGLFQQSVL